MKAQSPLWIDINGILRNQAVSGIKIASRKGDPIPPNLVRRYSLKVNDKGEIVQKKAIRDVLNKMAKAPKNK